jgi:hypothetical protein
LDALLVLPLVALGLIDQHRQGIGAQGLADASLGHAADEYPGHVSQQHAAEALKQVRLA